MGVGPAHYHFVSEWQKSHNSVTVSQQTVHRALRWLRRPAASNDNLLIEKVYTVNRALYALALAVSGGLALNAPLAFGAVTEAQVQQLLDRIDAQDKRIAELEKSVEQQAAARIPAPAPVVAAAAPAPAPSPSVPSPAAWADKISIQGDLRYRFEQINQEISADRNRQRLRARTVIIAKPQADLQVGFGLSTSQGDDPISQNQTIGNNGAPSDIYVNLAYFNWTALPGLNVTGGQFKNFLYRPGNQGLLWDGDWNPQGLGATYTKGPFFANAIGTWLESDSADTKEFTYGAQLGATVDVGDGVKLTGGVGYFHFDTKGKGVFYGSDTAFFGNSFDALTDTYLFDYNELEVFAQLGFKLAGFPVAVYGDYVKNTDADKYDTGWAAGVSVGAAKARGTWQASAGYQVLDPDAVFGALTDSDFGGGGTDNEGIVLRGAYALSDRVNVAFGYFINTIDQDVGTEQDYDRLQLDLNFTY